MSPAEIAEALRIAKEAREVVVTCNVCQALGGCRVDVPALAALVERMARELARLPSAEVLAEMRTRVEEALDETATAHGDPLELLRLLAEDLSDVLDAIAPPPTKTT